MPKKNIALYTSVEGHLSIAQAIQQLLEPQYTVHTYSTRDPSFDFYLPFYRNYPGAFRRVYNLARNSFFVKLVEKFLLLKYKKIVFSFNRHHHIDLCISTYFMYNPSLQKYCAQEQIGNISVIPDPRTVHPLLISEQADVNITFDAAHQKECQKVNSHAKYLEVGWFVRQEYTPAKSKHAAKKKINLDPEILTFLVTSGSEGTNLIASIFPFLLQAKTALQIIVSCGNNQLLLHKVEKLAQEAQKSTGAVTIIPLPFTTKLYEYMQAADLVIGKAGPNTIFESAATLTPFFAITHIAGQEDGNLDIIREHNLGYVQEDPAKAAELINEIVAHPEMLKTFESDLKKLNDHNKSAQVKFLSLVGSLLRKDELRPAESV
jgi:UDP-N-acetylglucosamine:LPS N-acetylglucosamine transferase